jgi:hypothetical protein
MISSPSRETSVLTAGLGIPCRQIGITPDWRVDSASLPLDMQGLCGAVLAQKQAPSLFGDLMQ